MSPGEFSNRMKEKRDRYSRASGTDLARKMHELWTALKPKLRPAMRHWFTEEHKVRHTLGYSQRVSLIANAEGSYVMVRDAAQLRSKSCYDEHRRSYVGAR